MDASDEFDFYADTFDSRDAAARIKFLEDKAEDEGLDEEEQAELDTLKALEEESGVEWEYGMTFVRESYFEDYARQYAEEVGAIPDEGYNWPASYIDWDAAARDLRMDYSAFDIRGETYYAR